MANVVYNINKKYLELMKASCYSLITNTTIDLDIYIITAKNEISLKNQEDIKFKFSSLRDNVSLHFVTSQIYEDWEKEGVLYNSHWFSKAVFLRCVLHNAILKDWVTSLDADTIVLKNIDNFLLDIPANPIAATLDLNYYKNVEHSYFCSAVYKTSLNYWRKNSLEKECKKLFKNKFDFPEQDVMNSIFKDNVTILPPKYCVQTFHKSATMVNTLTDPSIIHFAGPSKPNSVEYKLSDDWDMAWQLNNDAVNRLFKY